MSVPLPFLCWCLQVLESMTITTGLHQKESGRLKHRTTLRLTFLPHKEYRYVYAVTPSQVLTFVEKEFIPKILMKDIHNSFKHKRAMWWVREVCRQLIMSWQCESSSSNASHNEMMILLLASTSWSLLGSSCLISYRSWLGWF